MVCFYHKLARNILEFWAFICILVWQFSYHGREVMLTIYIIATYTDERRNWINLGFKLSFAVFDLGNLPIWHIGQSDIIIHVS